MNEITTIHQLLADLHPDLLPRWQELQLAWLSAQAQKRAEDKLTQYIVGDLSPIEAQEIEAFIAMDRQMAQLVAELKTLYTHFLQVDDEIQRPTIKAIPPHLLNRQGAYGWRGGEEFVQLPVQSFYPFEVLLFMLDGFTHQERSIRGQLIGRQNTVDVTDYNGAKVWFIPPYVRNGKSAHPPDATVQDGFFRLRGIPAGVTYTFEMAWGRGEFLEVLDVTIPAG